MSAAITAAAIGAGATVYGASQAGKGDGSAPAPVDIFKVNKQGIHKGTSVVGRTAKSLFRDYYPKVIPQALKASQQYGPQLLGHMFSQTGQFLGGVGGQPGLQALQRTTGAEAGKTLAQLRAEELTQQAGQAGMVRNLMAALSPEQAAAVQGSTQEAQRARLAAQGVTPQEQRMYQQAAREAAQASGRLGGNAAMAAEVMGREDVLAQKRAEAANAERQSYGLAGEFYTNPGLQALRAVPLSYAAGEQDLRTALTLGPASSGDFDYNTPINFALQQAGAQNQANQAAYQTSLANQQAKAQMWSGIGSSFMGLASSMGGGSGNYGGILQGGSGVQQAQSPWGTVNYRYI